MIDWRRKIQEWSTVTHVEAFPSPTERAVEIAKEKVSDFPRTLAELLRATNGLNVGSLKILPVEDDQDIKRTWDSVQRANDPKVTRFLGRSPELLKRFVVFADVGAGRAAAFDRLDSSIWHEDDGDLRQTNVTLEEFVDAFVREQSEF